MPDLDDQIDALAAEVTAWQWPPAIVANHDRYPAVAERDARTRGVYAASVLERLQSARDALDDGDEVSAGAEYDRAFSLWAHFVGQWEDVAAQRERQRRGRRDVIDRFTEDTIPEAIDAARNLGRDAAKSSGNLALAVVAVAVIYVVSRKR